MGSLSDSYSYSSYRGSYSSSSSADSMGSSSNSMGSSIGSSSMEADIYVKASDQVGICPTGYVPIRTSEECEDAAEYLGEDDLSVELWDHFGINIPSGCWFYNDELRFNNDPGNWNFNGNNGHVFVLCKQETEISEEPTIDETVQITTSEPGQSCDNACGAIEKECVEDMLIHQSAEEVASWALSVGVSCSSIVDRCDIGESPIFNYSVWGNENLCTFCSNPNHPGWLG